MSERSHLSVKKDWSFSVINHGCRATAIPDYKYSISSSKWYTFTLSCIADSFWSIFCNSSSDINTCLGTRFHSLWIATAFNVYYKGCIFTVLSNSVSCSYISVFYFYVGISKYLVFWVSYWNQNIRNIMKEY